jgi:hypothetical protein
VGTTLELAAGGIMASRNPPPQGERPGPEVISGTRLTALDLAPTALPSPAPGFLGLCFEAAPLSTSSELDFSLPSAVLRQKAVPDPPTQSLPYLHVWLVVFTFKRRGLFFFFFLSPTQK